MPASDRKLPGTQEKENVLRHHGKGQKQFHGSMMSHRIKLAQSRSKLRAETHRSIFQKQHSHRGPEVGERRPCVLRAKCPPSGQKARSRGWRQRRGVGSDRRYRTFWGTLRTSSLTVTAMGTWHWRILIREGTGCNSGVTSVEQRLEQRRGPGV